ncbi:hypothetical protein CPB86DRAFT_197996 [Serendipita vermifera]|nr:hypothetical protein CPB86DRAFT_197996 [Serendipita vermifera]
MNDQSSSFTDKDNYSDDTLIPSLDDLFWEYMNTHKRYALSQDEYEKEWSIWLRIYLFGNSLAMTKASASHSAGDPSLPLSLAPTQPTKTGHSPLSFFRQPDLHGPRQCTICLREYPRIAGAKGCENRHLRIKPYVCTKRCGNENCTMTFAAEKEWHRHDCPPETKMFHCDSCGKRISKQNRADHIKKYCKGTHP